jgi:hypothetical protein
MPKDRDTVEGLLERMGKNWPKAVHRIVVDGLTPGQAAPHWP